MESIKFTEGNFIISPISSNLVISEKTKECICIVMSGEYDGIIFTRDRAIKHNNAKLLARSKAMYNFLVKLNEKLPNNNLTSAFGNCRNEMFDENNTIGRMIEILIKF